MGHQYSVGYILRDEIGNVIGWYGAKTYTFFLDAEATAILWGQCCLWTFTSFTRNGVVFKIGSKILEQAIRNPTSKELTRG